MKDLRKKYFVIMTRCTVLILILMWATLPAYVPLSLPYLVLKLTLCSYWGALASQATRTRNLNAWFVDRDGSRLGHALWTTFGNTSAPGPQLGWTSVDPNTVGTDAHVAQAVLDEQAWIVVVGTHKSAYVTRMCLS